MPDNHTDLRPCPFCGQASVRVQQAVLSKFQVGPEITPYNKVVVSFQATCQGCGATGPEQQTPTLALLRWNVRANDNLQTQE